jgi:DNA-binding MarR family transcriptional regulator
VREAPDPREVGAAVHVSVGLLLHRLRQNPVQEELTISEISALTRLDRAGSATPGELAKLQQISPQGMGATLAALEDRGLVERHEDPSDGRRVVMSVTATGRQMLDNKRTARAVQLGKALSDNFTPDEMATLMVAAQLIERLGEAI